MFVAALFTIAKKWNKATIKRGTDNKNGILLSFKWKKNSGKQMNLECVILSEVKQFHREACVFSHVQNLTSVCV